MDDDDLIRNFTPDVQHVLKHKRFFELLDDCLSPEDPTKSPLTCKGNHGDSTAILTSLGFDSTDIDDILQVLHSEGGCCDCEILYNIAEESRLRSKYWKARHAQIAMHPTKAGETN